MTEGKPEHNNWAELMAASIPGLLWSTDTALRIVTCQGSDASGSQMEGLCGQSLFEVFRTEDIQHPLIQAHRSALEGETLTTSFLFAGACYRGKVAPLRDGDKIVGCITMACVLSSVESRCEAVAATTGDLMLFLTPTGMIQDANRTATGSSRESVIGKSLFAFTPRSQHERIRQALDEVIFTGRTVTLEICFPRRFDTPAWQIMRIGPVRGAGEVTGLVLLATDVTQQKRNLEKLEAEERLLRDLLLLQDRERRLVAYEIHDGFIQDVVGARMIVQGLRQTLNGADTSVHKRIDTSVSLMARAINEGRRLISELRPMIIDEMGLIDAIDYLISEEEARGELEFRFEHRVSTDRLPSLLQSTIFRIVSEAVTNARRHGQATRVDIRLTQIGSQFLIVEIQDNGHGFDPNKVPKDRFGLTGICERARLFGGGASIESAPEKGTRITVKVAFEAADHTGGDDQANWTWTV